MLDLIIELEMGATIAVWLVILLLTAEQVNSFVWKGRSSVILPSFQRKLHPSSTRLNAFWNRQPVTLAPTNENERLLFGRVPFDDWMFTNWKLTDPNLYKRTYLESVR